jgi:hypothetical protein
MADAGHDTWRPQLWLGHNDIKPTPAFSQLSARSFPRLLALKSANVRGRNFRTIYIAPISHELDDSVGKLAFHCTFLFWLYVQNCGHASSLPIS